jgi:hypothetical protein
MERNGQTEATPTVKRKTVGHTTPGTGWPQTDESCERQKEEKEEEAGKRI